MTDDPVIPYLSATLDVVTNALGNLILIQRDELAPYTPKWNDLDMTFRNFEMGLADIKRQFEEQTK